jgi:outer membrane protein assembly factor BamB
MKRISLLIPTVAICALTSSTTYADIPAWRGNNNGTFNVKSAPVDWTQNILFETPLDSKSNGTPILVNDRLYFTAEPDQLICADSKTGKILWQQDNSLFTLRNVSAAKRAELEAYQEEIEKIEKQSGRLRNDIRRLDSAIKKTPDNQEAKASKKEKEAERASLEKQIEDMAKTDFFKDYAMPPAHSTNGYTSYSPHFDGERIYAQFGYGVVVAYDLDGNREWVSFMEKPDHHWGGATMPQIVGDKLLVRFSDYTALDPKTGDKLWSTPSDVVFGTPVPFEVEEQHFVFTARGEVIRMQDGKVVQDGLVYTHPTRGWSIFNTPAFADGIIYAASGVEKENGDAYAYRVPKTLKEMNKHGLGLVWHSEIEKDRYYGSPLVDNGLVYLVTRENIVIVLEAETGEEVYTKAIRGITGTAYPSLVLADGNIYLGAEDGFMVIFKAGRTYQEIGRNRLAPYRATPVFVNEVAYLRTYESLVAVGKL